MELIPFCHAAVMNKLRPLGLLALATLAACGAGGSDSPTQPAEAAPATEPAQSTPASAPASASATPRLAQIGSFESPVFVTAPPGDRSRVFVVEQTGRIIVLVGGKRRAAPFLDIRSRVTSGGEQGLLSMAFSPDFAKTRKFYVYYTDRGSRQRVVEYKAGVSNANRAVLGSARTVLVMADPEGNHNGGQLQFGRDGMLYIGTGDGGGADDQHGSRGNGQDLGSLLGKLLRIDPRKGRTYAVPASNPFVKRSGARREIWSYGLRNPWRFSFDRQTGDLVIGDVGQNEQEEVDFATRAGGLGRGTNWGWRPRRGDAQELRRARSGRRRPRVHAQP